MKSKPPIVEREPNGRRSRKPKLTNRGHRPQNGNKRLTDLEKLTIAAEKQLNPDMSYPAIAQKYGISWSTAYVICNDEELKSKLQAAESVKKGMAADYHLTAAAMLGSITPDDIQGINAYQRVIAAAAATDKALRIEQGAPPAQTTQIQVNVQLNELQEQLKDLLRSPQD